MFFESEVINDNEKKTTIKKPPSVSLLSVLLRPKNVIEEIMKTNGESTHEIEQFLNELAKKKEEHASDKKLSVVDEENSVVSEQMAFLPRYNSFFGGPSFLESYSDHKASMNIGR